MPTSDSEDSVKPTTLSKSKTSRRKKSLELDSSDGDKKSTTKSRITKPSTKKELTSDDDDSDLQKEIKKLKDDLKKTKQKNRELTDKCESLEETIGDNERKFTKEKKRFEKTITKKSEEYEDYESKYRNLELKNEELVEQVDALKEECAKKNGAIQAMKVKLVEMNASGVSMADHHRLVTESKVKQAEIDDLKYEKVRLTEKLKHIFDLSRDTNVSFIENH